MFFRLKTSRGKNGTVSINGRSFAGRDVVVQGNKVVVDGVTQEGELVGDISVQVVGDVESLKLAAGGVTISGDVGSISTASGDVECGDVGGSVSTMSGDITRGKP